MIHPPEPWDWPQDWYNEFEERRVFSKTYSNVYRLFSVKNFKSLSLYEKIIYAIFNRQLSWHSIKLPSVTMETLNWLCKDNTKSKWTFTLKHIQPTIENYPGTHLVFTFYFKNKKDLLLFKMRW